MIGIDEYVRFLDQEYLTGYIDHGGAAVKFAVAPDEGSADAFARQVQTAARAAGYVVATVDAAATRVHLLEQVFFDVARQVDWDGLASATVRTVLEAAGYPAPLDGNLSIDRLAAHHDVEASELKRDINRKLQARVHRDYHMVQEFRTAMLRLCQAQLQTGQVAEAEHAAVLEWLQGELKQITRLKSALIFRRIGRHNARSLLFSLAHWLAVNKQAGLVLILDIRRLAVIRRPSTEDGNGYYYSKTLVLDAYEVFRQLVDNTDELANTFVVVIASPNLLTDAHRGLDAYQALKLRIFDEVRDRLRDNPFSSLVRLGAQ